MMGLGIIELLVLLLVFGGVVLAMRGGSSARKWVIGGLLVMLLCGVVLWVVGFQSTRVVHRARLHQTQSEIVGFDAAIQAELARYRAQLAAIHSAQSSERPPAVVAPRPTDKPAAPDWVVKPPDDANLHVVVSEQYASKTEARAEASNKASNLVLKKVHERWHLAGVGGYPNYVEVEQQAIRDRHTRKIIRTTEDNVFTVYRSFVLVDTSPRVMASFEKIVKKETKAVRAIQVGIAGIVLTVVVGLIAGFFRIDERTKGRYRWKLIAGMILIGLMMVNIVPWLIDDWTPHALQTTPMPTPVSEEPADQVIIIPKASPHRLIEH